MVRVAHNIPSAKILLKRGDILQIVGGHLNIIARSGVTVPSPWFKKHDDNLIFELINQLGVDALIYDSYKAKRYGSKHTAVCVFSLLSCYQAKVAMLFLMPI